MDNLVQCLEKVTDIDPFPVGYLETINETATGTYLMLQHKNKIDHGSRLFQTYN